MLHYCPGHDGKRHVTGRNGGTSAMIGTGRPSQRDWGRLSKCLLRDVRGQCGGIGGTHFETQPGAGGVQILNPYAP